MKFYKRLPINRKDPISNAFAVEADGRIVTNTHASIQAPGGTTAQRPTVLSNGEIRYNTELGTGELEAYINGSWQIVKTNRQAEITVNTYTNGDYLNTIFGPLSYNIDIAKPQNVMVYVENVYQVPTTNYTLEFSSVGSPITTSTMLSIDANLSDTTLYLDSIANFNIGNPISGTNVDGNIITAVNTLSNSIDITPGTSGSVSSGTLIISTFNTGTYVVFTDDAVPVPNKPVTVLQGFDGYNPPFEV